VKGHVAKIQAVIAAAREEELKAAAEERMKRELLRQQQQQQQQQQMYQRQQMAPMNAMCAAPGAGGAAMSMARSAPAPPMAMRSMAMGRSARSMAMSDAGPPPPPQTGNASAAPTAPTPSTSTATGVADVAGDAAHELDYTKLPQMLDSQFEKLDTDSALRPTTIKPGEVWDLKSQAGLLSKPTTSVLRKDEQRTAKQAAFDLIDALTRSGALAIDAASFHVVLVATHCFDMTLIDTVIQKNVNPIEKVERSVLIVASTVMQAPVEALVRPNQLARLQETSPVLFGGGAALTDADSTA
jgi:hypothetical protein